VNWEALTAVSELTGAVAVVVTLAYVAIQIRQNTSALRSTATQAAHDQASGLYDLLATDGTLAELYTRGLTAPDALTVEETARFFSLSMGFMFRYQNWYLQTQSDLIDNELLESWARVLRQVSGTPGFKRFWQQRGYIFAPEFTAYLERDVFAAEPDPSYRPLGISPLVS